MIIRPAHIGDEFALAAVHIETWNATYRGLLDDSVLDAMTVRDIGVQWIRTLEHGSTTVFAAQNEHQEIVGYAGGGKEASGRLPFDSEVYTLYVLPRYQRMGLGNRLLRAEAAHLESNGGKSLVIWVLKGNPSAQFYLKMGGTVVAEKPTTLGSHEYKEIAFGWQDITRVGHDPFAYSHTHGTA